MTYAGTHTNHATHMARAAAFAKSWANETYERSKSLTFWNDFFEIFERSRQAVASYERYARRLAGRRHIDVFWPGVLLVEHKSTGKSYDDTMQQADEYMIGLPDNELPRYILACDFARFYLIDADTRSEYKFTLEELPENVGLFGFMADKPGETPDTDPVNQEAAKLMGDMYNTLYRTGYPPEDTKILLIRLAFCMFADDSGIFQHGAFAEYLKDATDDTVGIMLNDLFQMLNTPIERRQSGLAEQFPYIDGKLFRDHISVSKLSKDMIIRADTYNWSKISPAIFGGMFQSIMDSTERRKAGVHYTTEENIMRVIKPLFLDRLYEEFDHAKHSKISLERFQNKLARLRFLDPACGSGNFLAISYRELRKLETKIIVRLHDTKVQRLDIKGLSKVDVHQFYGIEINPFSAQIAEMSMWMTDHLMNRYLGEQYGVAYTRLPLRRSPDIRCADALDIDWNDIIPASECSYILGNPPYGGSKIMTKHQRRQIQQISDIGGSGGTLDYVAGWFLKAAQYTEENHTIRIGFVATSSITQGEQVAQLWPILFDKYGLRIEFAYKSFKWGSEAPGMAQVFVVIIGLARDVWRCSLFHTDADIKDNPPMISPYLLGATRLRMVRKSHNPLNGLPDMVMGSQPIDNGHYIFTESQKTEFLKSEPGAESYIRPYIGAKDYIHGTQRYILVLHDMEPATLRRLPLVTERVGRVKRYRLKSISPSTRQLADTPTIYHHNVLPDRPFLIIPSTSSETRKYIPIGYLQPPAIPSNAAMVVQNASVELFGLLTSYMHMVWLAYIGGRLKSDFRYSAGMVYNTFPVPDSNLTVLEPYAQQILKIRDSHPDSTLADLYDPDTMPPDLVRAHRKLDRVVDRLYRKESFRSNDGRIEFLLERYYTMIDRISA